MNLWKKGHFTVRSEFCSKLDLIVITKTHKLWDTLYIHLYVCTSAVATLKMRFHAPAGRISTGTSKISTYIRVSGIYEYQQRFHFFLYIHT